jgi:hypothetical protein
VTDSFNHLNATIAHDESLARIFRIGSADLDELTDDERVRFSFLFLGAFRIADALERRLLQLLPRRHRGPPPWAGRGRKR